MADAAFLTGIAVQLEEAGAQTAVEGYLFPQLI